MTILYAFILIWAQVLQIFIMHILKSTNPGSLNRAIYEVLKLAAPEVYRKKIYIFSRRFTVYVGNKKAVIDSVDVHTEKIYPTERFYGNLGQDFTTKFNEIILNFTYMYFSAN